MAMARAALGARARWNACTCPTLSYVGTPHAYHRSEHSVDEDWGGYRKGGGWDKREALGVTARCNECTCVCSTLVGTRHIA
eukprot:129132-Rhodomonas_salina.1